MIKKTLHQLFSGRNRLKQLVVFGILVIVLPLFILSMKQSQTIKQHAAGSDVLTVDVTKPIHSFTPYNLGVAMVNWEHAWGKPYADQVPGLEQAFKAAHVGLIRYAGGNWANWVGFDPAQAAPNEYTDWTHNGYTYSFNYGTDEISSVQQLAQNIGADVMVQTNISMNDPDMWASMVRYTNAAGKYKIKYWEEGNELDYQQTNDPSVYVSPADYGTRMISYQQKMRAVDPTVQFIGAAQAFAYSMRYDNTLSDYFYAPLQETNAAGSVIDGVSYHWYQQCNSNTLDDIMRYQWYNDDGTAQPLTQWQNNYARIFADYMPPTVSSQILSQYPSKKMLQGITELNFDACNYDNVYNGNHINAIWFSDILGRLAYHGLDFSTMYEGYGSQAYGMLYPNDPNAPSRIDARPSYYAFLLYGQYFGDQMVQAQSTNNDAISIYASTDSKDPKKLKLRITNLSATDLTVPVQLTGFSAADGKMYVLQSTNPTDVTTTSNTAQSGTNINGIKIDAMNVATSLAQIQPQPIVVNGSSFTQTYAAYSSTAIILNQLDPSGTPVPTVPPVSPTPKPATPTPTPTLTPTIVPTLPPPATNPKIIYDGKSTSLSTDWGDCSYNGTVSYTNTSPVLAGTTHSIKAILPSGAAFSICSNPFVQTGPYGFLEMSIYAAGPGVQPSLTMETQDVNQPDIGLSSYIQGGDQSFKVNTWEHVVIPLSVMGVVNQQMVRIFMQTNGGANPSTMYISGMRLLPYTTVTPTPTPITTRILYDTKSGSIGSGFWDHSWAPVTYNNTAPVLSGGYSLKATLPPYQAFGMVGSSAQMLNTTGYKAIDIWLQSSATGNSEDMQVSTDQNDFAGQGQVNLNEYIQGGDTQLVPNKWEHVIVPLSAVSSCNVNIWQILIFGNNQALSSPPPLYFDTLSLTAGSDPACPGAVTTTPNPTATSTPTSTPIPTLTRTPTPTVTTVPNTTKLSLTIGLDGIGKAGDNVSRGTTGNTSPQHPTRNVTLNLSDQNNNPLPAVSGQVVYDSVSGLFKGTVALPTTVTTGVYTLKVSSPSFLQKAIPAIITITSGQTATVPTAYLTAGDINNDNQISLLDYNLILGCFGSSVSNCMPSDLDDTGSVGGADYNLFLRELSVQNGG